MQEPRQTGRRVEMTPCVRPASSRPAVVAAVAGTLLVLLVVGGLMMSRGWFNSAEAQPQGSPESEFAADRFPASKPVPFDGKRAMGYLEEICKLGPRISGSEAMKKQQELLAGHFEKLGGKISWQRFKARQRSVDRETEMANLVVSWGPNTARRIILCGHYDTRPQADEEPDPRRRAGEFLGANDGGSGTALLMELAHHMKDLDLKVGVDFVFFDGEEWVFDSRDTYFFGSMHFAQEYRRTQARVQYQAAVLLDMVAGKGAKFPIEQNSWWWASGLVRQVWGIAKELGLESFPEAFSKVAVQDDHLPLNRAGIPAIDIIDFDYPHWHRLSDVPENCSGETMAEVASVVGVWIQRAR